jgi:hypothetical protein
MLRMIPAWSSGGQLSFGVRHKGGLDVAYFSSCSSGDSGGEEGMSQFLGPGQVDQAIRQAIQLCWMSLPKDKRNVEEVENQIRRLVDRALQDLREDGEVFRRPDA